MDFFPSRGTVPRGLVATARHEVPDDRRAPRAEDLIVPSLRGAPRNVNRMLRRFHEDLERVGLRARRQHDTRRKFISIARADGARPDVLRWATHGSTGDIVDDYTTLPWSALCGEVAKVRIRSLELPVGRRGRRRRHHRRARERGHEPRRAGGRRPCAADLDRG
jgi:hypothetical protein